MGAPLSPLALPPHPLGWPSTLWSLLQHPPGATRGAGGGVHWPQEDGAAHEAPGVSPGLCLTQRQLLTADRPRQERGRRPLRGAGGVQHGGPELPGGAGHRYR